MNVRLVRKTATENDRNMKLEEPKGNEASSGDQNPATVPVEACRPASGLD